MKVPDVPDVLPKDSSLVPGTMLDNSLGFKFIQDTLRRWKIYQRPNSVFGNSWLKELL